MKDWKQKPVFIHSFIYPYWHPLTVTKYWMRITILLHYSIISRIFVSCLFMAFCYSHAIQRKQTNYSLNVIKCISACLRENVKSMLHYIVDAICWFIIILNLISISITLFYYIPTFFTIKSASTDFTTNKIFSRITSCLCKSVCLHARNAVMLTLIRYE